MSIAWVRNHYKVPAKVGGRVEYTGESKPQFGTICGTSGGHLSMRLDGVKHSMPFHPTWKLRYLDAEGSEVTRPQRQSPTASSPAGSALSQFAQIENAKAFAATVTERPVRIMTLLP